MTRIVEHLSVEELERRCRAAQDATEARHTQAIWLLAQGRRLLAQGRSVLDVAGVLAFAPRWVEQQLAARYNAHGPEALGDQRRRNKGRAASVLTPALLAALSERLRTPPEDGGRWTGAKVALWMARQLGVERGCTRSAAGRRSSGSAGRCRRRARATRARPRPSSRPSSQEARRRGRECQGRAPGPAGRGLGRGRSDALRPTASA